MKYPCLVLDHDDTVVKSTVQLHYPAFVHTMAILRPDVTPLSCTEFQEACAHPGLTALLEQTYGYTEEEMAFELADWRNYVKDTLPDAYEGFRELLIAYRQAGGILCVVSQSDRSLIVRDYRHHFALTPDYVYDLSYTPQKPDPAPLLDIMQKTGLTAGQLLTVDDLPAGKQMADAAGVDFAYAGWCNNPPSVHRQMTEQCALCPQNPAQLASLLGIAGL